jgi:hypothetical protein
VYDLIEKYVYVASEQGYVQLIDLSVPTEPRLTEFALDITDQGTINDIAVGISYTKCRALISMSPPSYNGLIVFFLRLGLSQPRLALCRRQGSRCHHDVLDNPSRELGQSSAPGLH